MCFLKSIKNSMYCQIEEARIINTEEATQVELKMQNLQENKEKGGFNDTLGKLLS